MKRCGRSLWGPIAAAIVVALGANEAWSQKHTGRPSQQQSQQSMGAAQQQFMQRAMQSAAGPAGALTPNAASSQPTEGAFWGEGSQLQSAIQDAQKKIEAEQRSGKAISAEQLGLALPPAIGEYVQVELKMPPPPPPGGEVSAQSVAPSVSATYKNPAKQSIEVTLTDLGVMMALLSREGAKTGEEESVQSSDSGQIVLQTKKIEGMDAKIYYDRVRESGSLNMNANRISVGIKGENIPMAMLEQSAVELKVGELAKLGK